MKKTLKLFLIVLSLLIHSQSFAQNPPITDGLVGYWPFNGVYTDNLGNYNSINTYGSITYSAGMQGENNGACFFDGASCLIVDDVGTINLGSFSISVWINAQSFGSEASTGVSYGRIARKEFDFDLMTFDNQGSSTINFVVENTALTAPNSSITLDTWHHIVATYNGTLIVLFIDGIQVGSTTLTGSSTNNNPIIIGNYNSGSTPRFFNGSMIDFSIFNRALNENEIREIYQNVPTACTWSCNGENIVYNNGNVGIGTSTPDQKLTVKGKIHTEEVLIDLNIPVPDYVFEADYPLTKIEEVEQYVNENKHLPEIPSACEIEKTGLGVGEMNMKLLKKIEELTLYLIELNKEVKAIKQENKELKTEINQLKNSH